MNAVAAYMNQQEEDEPAMVRAMLARGLGGRFGYERMCFMYTCACAITSATGIGSSVAMRSHLGMHTARHRAISKASGFGYVGRGRKCRNAMAILAVLPRPSVRSVPCCFVSTMYLHTVWRVCAKIGGRV